MANEIDHVVIVVRDLARASADFSRAGFTVTPGGEHADGATHNALIPFADGSYIELIAFKEPDTPSTHQWWPRLAQGEGLVHYALRSDDLAADVARLRAAEFAISDPRDGGRTRPDGQALRWRTAAFDGDFALPFLIEDVTPLALRVPGGEATAHPLGVVGIGELKVVAADLAAAAGPLAELFGAPPQVALSASFPYIGVVRLRTADHWIKLKRPGDPRDAAGAAYAQFGAGPYELVLVRRIDRESEDRGEPLAGDLHGARISVVE